MARRIPLVCQFPENISRAALEEYQDIVRDFVRGRHGVYALYRRNKLYYVGLAQNLRNRLTQHLKDRHGASPSHGRQACGRHSAIMQIERPVLTGAGSRIRTGGNRDNGGWFIGA